MTSPWAKLLFWSYLLFLVWAETTVTNPADPDLWHHLALGEFLLKTGHFPLGDTFSYLADYQKIADHEWGSAVVIFVLYHLAGTGAIVAMKIVTLTITLALVVWAGLWQRRPSALLLAFYALILLAILPSFQSTVRCMTFTHIFFALWLYWFQRERHGWPVSTFWYFITMILWANLHGGFVIGLAWLLAVGLLHYFYQEPWRHWVLRLGLCSLATLINPFGWKMVAYYPDHPVVAIFVPDLWLSTARALVTTRRGFEEWAPVTWFADFGSYPGYKLLLLGTLIALAILIKQHGWKRVDQPVIVLLGAFLLLSLLSARHTSLFAVVAGALLPGLFPPAPLLSAIAHPLNRLGYVALCAVLLITPLFSAMIVLPGKGLELEYPPISCPVAAVDFLKEQNIHGKLLVPFNYGSYALWKLRKHMRVSMDGRYDLVYRPQTFQRVEDFFAAKPGWPTLLTTPAPDAILLPLDDAIYPQLQNLPAWHEAYRDNTDAIFLPQR